MADIFFIYSFMVLPQKYLLSNQPAMYIKVSEQKPTGVKGAKSHWNILGGET